MEILYSEEPDIENFECESRSQLRLYPNLAKAGGKTTWQNRPHLWNSPMGGYPRIGHFAGISAIIANHYLIFGMLFMQLRGVIWGLMWPDNISPPEYMGESLPSAFFDWYVKKFIPIHNRSNIWEIHSISERPSPIRRLIFGCLFSIMIVQGILELQ